MSWKWENAPQFHSSNSMHNDSLKAETGSEFVGTSRGTRVGIVGIVRVEDGGQRYELALERGRSFPPANTPVRVQLQNGDLIGRRRALLVNIIKRTGQETLAS